MAREETVIFTNLCMITDGQGNVLVQDRKDPNWPGIVFPGGHVEPEEAFTDAVIREVWEETGLTIHHPILCGVKQFQTKTGARYVVFLYRCSKYSGELHSSDEGEVYWMPRSQLQNCLMPEGFQPTLAVLEQDDLTEMIWLSQEETWRYL